MTVEERTEATMKMLNVLAEKEITPGDVQEVCLSIIAFVYRKAGATKSLAPEIAVDVMNQTMGLLLEALPEEGGEE